MYKVLNILVVILISVFLLSVYKHYSSNKNISNKNYNRLNIDTIIQKKISDLPVLLNDTNNVVTFNNSIDNDTINEKKRSFWNLLKRINEN